MKSSFAESLNLVLKHEGGYVDHPFDPGGATNMGITIGTLRQWRGKPVSKQDVRALTLKEVGDIYRARYWSSLRCDDMPKGLDYALFDYGVNSGVARAARAMQSLLGVAQDGVVGGFTIKAASRHDARILVNALCNQRMSFLQRLRTWNAFGKGWTNRLRGVRAQALAMSGDA